MIKPPKADMIKSTPRWSNWTDSYLGNYRAISRSAEDNQMRTIGKDIPPQQGFLNKQQTEKSESDLFHFSHKNFHDILAEST